MPEPLPLRKVLGPSVILAGVGRRLRRVHPLAVHQRQRGDRVPLPGRRRRDHPVLPQHGDRALHARHGRDRDRRVRALLEAVGHPLLLLRGRAEHLAGLGDRRRDDVDLPRGRVTDRDRDHRAAVDRGGVDDVAGRLQVARARGVLQGRADDRLPDRRDLRRDRPVGVGRAEGERVELRHAADRRRRDLDTARRPRLRGRGRRQQPRPVQLDPREGLRDGRLRAQDRIAADG